MPVVVIPVQMRKLTHGVERVEITAGDVQQAIAALESRYPGIESRLCHDGQLRAGLAVAVDGAMSSRGLMQKLRPDSEVHFLPAIGGG